MYEVRPFEGVAEARFGEDRVTLHARLGAHDTFRKAGAERGLADHYVARELIAHHDHLGQLYYLELTDPDTFYKDVQLLEQPYAQVRDELAVLGARCIEHDDGGCDFPDLGFNLWADGDDDEPAQVVGLYPHEYRGASGVFTGRPMPPIKHHTVLPHRGTEQAELGAHRADLRARLGPGIHIVPAYGPAAEDNYIDHGLTLGFDQDDRLIAITISTLAESVTHHGIELYQRPHPEVIADLLSRGIPVETDELLIRTPGFSLLLNTPAPDALVAAILITSAAHHGPPG